jgi:hypothetical protein
MPNSVWTALLQDNAQGKPATVGVGAFLLRPTEAGGEAFGSLNPMDQICICQFACPDGPANRSIVGRTNAEHIDLSFPAAAALASDGL